MSPKYTIEDYQCAGTEIYEKLHLSTLPVGVKYIKSEEEIPDGVRRPVNEGKKCLYVNALRNPVVFLRSGH